MTSAARVPALERRWAQLLSAASIDFRLAAMVALARAGVLAAVGLDVRTAFILATDVVAPGTWRATEEIVGLADTAASTPSNDAWSAWTAFCALSEPVDLPDYRELLDERYRR